MATIIGAIKQREIGLLGLAISAGTAILIGPQNIEHMKNRHPIDYAKYGHHIMDIISSPKYISLHPTDGSIQYIKEYVEEGTDVRVLVAIRVARGGTLFARTLFVMSDEKWDHYNANGYIIEY